MAVIAPLDPVEDRSGLPGDALGRGRPAKKPFTNLAGRCARGVRFKDDRLHIMQANEEAAAPTTGQACRSLWSHR
jgi:hypothetical protein